MEARIDPAIRDPELRTRIDHANGQLQGIVGRLTNEAKAAWSLEPNGQGMPQVALQLSDGVSSVEGRFAAGELDNPEKFYWRLNRLWRDLLMQSTGQIVDNLLQHANDPDED